MWIQSASLDLVCTHPNEKVAELTHYEFDSMEGLRHLRYVSPLPQNKLVNYRRLLFLENKEFCRPLIRDELLPKTTRVYE